MCVDSYPRVVPPRVVASAKVPSCAEPWRNPHAIEAMAIMGHDWYHYGLVQVSMVIIISGYYYCFLSLLLKLRPAPGVWLASATLVLGGLEGW